MDSNPPHLVGERPLLYTREYIESAGQSEADRQARLSTRRSQKEQEYMLWRAELDRRVEALSSTQRLKSLQDQLADVKSHIEESCGRSEPCLGLLEQALALKQEIAMLQLYLTPRTHSDYPYFEELGNWSDTYRRYLEERAVAAITQADVAGQIGDSENLDIDLYLARIVEDDATRARMAAITSYGSFFRRYGIPNTPEQSVETLVPETTSVATA